MTDFYEKVPKMAHTVRGFHITCTCVYNVYDHPYSIRENEGGSS